MKVVPCPGSLSTAIWPPLWLMIPCTIERPSPVPAAPLVVKNGSKIWATVCSVHADPVVSDDQQRLALVGCPCDFDREVSAVGHRIASVDCQVRDHLLDLCPVGVDERRLVRPDGRQLDVFVDHPPQQLDHVGDDIAEVEDLGVHHLAAAEGEQLRGQARRLLSSSDDVADLGRAVVAAVDLAQRQLGVAADRESAGC